MVRRGVGAPKTEPKRWEQLESVRDTRDEYDVFLDLARAAAPLYLNRTRTEQLDRRPKELLGFLLGRIGRRCSLEEVYEAVWLRKPKYGADTAKRARRTARIEKAAKMARAIVVQSNIDLDIELERDQCWCDGAASFCVIPDEPVIAKR